MQQDTIMFISPTLIEAALNNNAFAKYIVRAQIATRFRNTALYVITFDKQLVTVLHFSDVSLRLLKMILENNVQGEFEYINEFGERAYIQKIVMNNGILSIVHEDKNGNAKTLHINVGRASTRLSLLSLIENIIDIFRMIRPQEVERRIPQQNQQTQYVQQPQAQAQTQVQTQIPNNQYQPQPQINQVNTTPNTSGTIGNSQNPFI